MCAENVYQSLIIPKANLTVRSQPGRCLKMGAQEEGIFRKKEFQKRSDEDMDAFLGKKDATRTASSEEARPGYDQKASSLKPEPKPEAKPEAEVDHEGQITEARASRAQAEAYHDVAVLRKKAHMHSHQAAKFFHKYRSNEAKAQKCSARAVNLREKSETRRERAKEYRLTVKEFDAELRGAAQGKSDLSPESLRTKMANTERRAAKQDAIARKYEHKAAIQTEKSAKFKTRGLRFLEKSRMHESESKNLTKRADNLEKAGA